LYLPRPPDYGWEELSQNIGRIMDQWQVGDVKITRIAELRNVRWPNFVFRSLSVDEVREQEWLLPNHATPEGQLISSTHAFVIECGSRKIIVDTCVGNDKVRKWPAWNDLQGPFLRCLEDAGHSPYSIDTVFCTHLHVDHVGWNTKLVDGRWVATFPNAQYLFCREEWEHWSKENDQERDGDVTPQVAQGVLEARAVFEDSLRPIVDAGLHKLVEANHALCEEIFLEPTPGHTPGHVSVHISSRGEEAVITGDLVHHPIQLAKPRASSTFDFDGARSIATRQEFFKRYADRDILILGTHFAPPTGGRIVTHGESWRFGDFGASR
jgi:glyoxylase-like metal-dependent hydrolase (beta-lactamase superfamily II)